MIPITGEAEITIILTSNGGFLVSTPRVTEIDPNSRMGLPVKSKLFVATTIDEVMIIVREQLEVLTVQGG